MKKISKEIREYDEWLDRKYAEREDKDNILPVGITDAEFREFNDAIFADEVTDFKDLLGRLANEIKRAYLAYMQRGILARIVYGKLMKEIEK